VRFFPPSSIYAVMASRYSFRLHLVSSHYLPAILLRLWRKWTVSWVAALSLTFSLVTTLIICISNITPFPLLIPNIIMVNRQLIKPRGYMPLSAHYILHLSPFRGNLSHHLNIRPLSASFLNGRYRPLIGRESHYGFNS